MEAEGKEGGGGSGGREGGREGGRPTLSAMHRRICSTLI